MISITARGEDLVLSGVSCFSPRQTFDCGQCFRFEEKDGVFEGVAKGKLLRIGEADGELIIYGCTEEEFRDTWESFLSLDTDYDAIFAEYAAESASVLGRAAEYGRGIRILRQDGWEALCSFIISQNNNIPRIKKIINALCESYGKPIESNGTVYHTFPSAERIAALSLDQLYALRMGFRAKYVHDAARKVVDKEIDLDLIADMSTEDACRYLCRIHGVGPKVASCALLFGFEKTDAFPIDVWVKRVLAKYYPDGLDIACLGKHAGLAQQYLFYYERYLGDNEKKQEKRN